MWTRRPRRRAHAAAFRLTPRADDESPRRRLVKTAIVWIMGAICVVSGAYGFAARFMSFILELGQKDGIAYSLVPIATYFFAAGGFFLMLVWAFLTGQLSDVEGPKRAMLEEQLALDERDAPEGYAHG